MLAIPIAASSPQRYVRLLTVCQHPFVNFAARAQTWTTLTRVQSANMPPTLKLRFEFIETTSKCFIAQRYLREICDGLALIPSTML